MAVLWESLGTNGHRLAALERALHRIGDAQRRERRVDARSRGCPTAHRGHEAGHLAAIGLGEALEKAHRIAHGYALAAMEEGTARAARLQHAERCMDLDAGIIAIACAP